MKFKKFIKESIDDMKNRCPECNTLLNDGGTCPKCDDGEEDYDDYEDVTECTKKSLTEMTNIEKLKAAYPELDLDGSRKDNKNVSLREAVGADTKHAVKDAMDILSKDDSKQWAKTVSEVVNVIPDQFADELFEEAEKLLGNIKLSDSDKEKITSSINVETDDTTDTVKDVFDKVEDSITKDPKKLKTLVMTTLSIIAIIEPTPVVDVITGILSLLPAEIIAKMFKLMMNLNPTVLAFKLGTKIRSKHNKNDSVQESFEENSFEYDDDYTLDDVEEDHIHASLYGGDRTYCQHCGKRLKRNEWGGYCPECDEESETSDDII